MTGIARVAARSCEGYPGGRLPAPLRAPPLGADLGLRAAGGGVAARLPCGPRRSSGGLGAGKGLWPGALWPERGAVQNRLPPPPRQGPATSGPAGTPRLPAACGVGAEVTHAGSGSPSEPRGLRPVTSSVRAKAPGTRVCCDIGSPVKPSPHQ